MAEVATERLRLRDTEIGWPLEELWVAGELLGPADSFESGVVVLVLDEPPDDLPWMALNPVGEWVGHELRLGKRPFTWFYRPLAWPVWNHENRRLARFWSADGGLDDRVVDALRARDPSGVTVVEPSPELFVEQVGEELAISRRHLRQTLEHYWDVGWRKAHGGYDTSPEDHLWRAATAVSDMQDALDEVGRAP
jgi:hypothetical protein